MSLEIFGDGTVKKNGNTALSINNTPQVSFENSVSQPGGFSLRNKIINGAMAIDQRNGGASQTITAAAALAYTVDRWYAYCTGANVTGQRVAGSGDTEYRYQFTGAASVTKIGFAQRIEGDNIYDLNNGTSTLSVDLANSLLTTVTWTAWYANTSDTFGTLASPTRTQIATGTFTVTSTVSRYSTQISIPSAATTGIEIEFSVESQTSGTWTIGNVQLERGSAATPFEQKPIGFELSLCQRYYESGGFFHVQSNVTNATNMGTTVWFKQKKRANPTITQTSTSVVNVGTTTQNAALPEPITQAADTTVGFLSFRTATSSASTSQYTEIWRASAEL